MASKQDSTHLAMGLRNLGFELYLLTTRVSEAGNTGCESLLGNTYKCMVDDPTISYLGEFHTQIQIRSPSNIHPQRIYLG